MGGGELTTVGVWSGGNRGTSAERPPFGRTNARPSPAKNTRGTACSRCYRHRLDNAQVLPASAEQQGTIRKGLMLARVARYRTGRSAGRRCERERPGDALGAFGGDSGDVSV